MELRLGTRPGHGSRGTRATAIASRVEEPVVRVGIARDWIAVLPVLQSAGVTLRELRSTDAASLLETLATEQVARFVSPPPTTVEGFEQFIAWTRAMRREGTYVCFAIVPKGSEAAVGILQFKALTPDFRIAEWGFALGAAYWGTGLFMESAALALDFAVEAIGVHRLEARAVTLNGRGNGVLTKLGAVREAILRQSFVKNGAAFDQYLWSILAENWRARRAAIDCGRRIYLRSVA